MALIQGLFAAVARSAGKVVNTAFGWATTLLFGKVSQDRQIYLSVISFGSAIWLIVVIGVIFPRFGAFLLTFARLPKWVNPNWIRIAMLVAAVIIPPVVGWASTKASDADQKPRSGGTFLSILRGYPYTLGLSLALVMMCLFAPVMKLQAIARRWKTEHVPVMIEPKDYESVVERTQSTLRDAGWPTDRQKATWMLRLPTKVLTIFAGKSVAQMVAENLAVLRSDRVEATLHPSDLVLAGKEADVAHVQAVVAEQLAFTKAYMTWSKEANQLEDRLNAIWQTTIGPIGRDMARASLRQIADIEEAIRRTNLPYDEWEVLDRKKLLLERQTLRVAAGISDNPPARVALPPHPQPAPEEIPARVGSRIGQVAAAALLAVVAFLGFRHAAAPQLPVER